MKGTLEVIYFPRSSEGDNPSCDCNALADAITAQFYATPVELRQPVTIANDFTYGRVLADILKKRGKVPVKLSYIKDLDQLQH